MDKSTQAQAASLIRAELKKHGIKARVSSESASMMTAVRVSLEDPLPATLRRVEKFCEQFQYGHFDGMQDLYEYSNKWADTPQVKYVSVTTNYSLELRQAAWDFVRNYWAGMEGSPEDVESSQSFYHVGSKSYGSDLVWQTLCGNRGGAQISSRFWAARKPRVHADT